MKKLSIPVFIIIAVILVFTFVDRYKNSKSLQVNTGSLLATDDNNRSIKLGLLPEENASSNFFGGALDSLFGISLSNYTIHGDRIQKNQFLSEILGECQVEYSLVDRLVRKAKSIFDVRDMKAGRPYTILCTADSLETAEYLIYEHDPTEYVVFDLRDTLNISIGQKEVTTVQKEAAGVIESSLYNAMRANGLSPLLVSKMADVYAWTVDFFHVQKGDRFKVVYEERYAQGEFIGIGEVKAALFSHYDNDFYAFQFDHEELEFNDYYDENAKTLRKAFLKAPLQFPRISSRYNLKRFHPVLKRTRPHLGTDYAASCGTPIQSTADGIVTHASYTRGNGNYVKVRHNSTYTTQYLHMSKFAKGMKAGKKVKQGDVIGYVGKTGLATGCHVCYRFWKNGSQVDPYKQKLPEAAPLDENLIPAYEAFLDTARQKLDGIPYPELKVEEEQEQEAVETHEEEVSEDIQS